MWNKIANTLKGIYLPLIILPLWLLAYNNLQWLTDRLVYDVLNLQKDAHLTEALRFFIFEVPKVLLLLTLIIFIVGIIRSYFSPEKTRKALEGKSLFTGNVMAATPGIATPICPCSAIPLFQGCLEFGIPLRVTYSYLIAPPRIHAVRSVVMFWMFA